VTADRSLDDVLSDVVHDIRTSVGSVRLAVTSLLGEEDDDPEYRRITLTAADDEVRRLNASLTAIPALTAAHADQGGEGAVPLASLMREAVREAGRRNVTVEVERSTRTRVQAKATAARTLGALLVVVDGGVGRVSVGIQKEAGHVIVRVFRSDGTAVIGGRCVVTELVRVLGIEATACDGILQLAFRVAP
jgi:signal transduction histidine kinase